MEKKEIIFLYDKGYSIDYIVNKFYYAENLKYKNYYDKQTYNFVVNKDRITKSQVRRYVEYVLLPYLRYKRN